MIFITYFKKSNKYYITASSSALPPSCPQCKGLRARLGVCFFRFGLKTLTDHFSKSLAPFFKKIAEIYITLINTEWRNTWLGGSSDAEQNGTGHSCFVDMSFVDVHHEHNCLLFFIHSNFLWQNIKKERYLTFRHWTAQLIFQCPVQMK